MCKVATPYTTPYNFRTTAAYRSCDPCGCTFDTRSGGAKVPFNGCANHADRGLYGEPWCYVTGGTACKAARADPLRPGSAWKQCADQSCECVGRTAAATLELSGIKDIDVSERGCADHDGRGYEWCWVRAGTACAKATPASDPSMRTAAWQKCNSSACDCIADAGTNPGMPLGCGPHFSIVPSGDARPTSLTTQSDVCYVKGGLSCARGAIPDNAYPGHAWRDCSQDCYGVGSSWSLETRHACNCFRGTKPGINLGIEAVPWCVCAEVRRPQNLLCCRFV